MMTVAFENIFHVISKIFTLLLRETIEIYDSGVTTATYPGQPSKVATTKRVSIPCMMLS